MARIRTVKPDFFASPKAAKVSIEARFLFLGLLTEADDAGKLIGSAKRIAGALFPNDTRVTDRRVVALLDELEAVTLIRRYVVDGVEYVWVPGFNKHQRISHPTPSKHPDPPELLAKSSGVTPENLPGEQGTGNREEGTGKCANAHAIDSDFEQVWQVYPRRNGRKEARDNYAALRRAGVSASALERSARNYADAIACEVDEEQFILLGKNFFGPAERWKDYLDNDDAEGAEGSEVTLANEIARTRQPRAEAT